MKILLITPTFYPDVGGVETMVSQFCDYSARRKFQVCIITYNPLVVKTKAPFKEKLNEYVTVWRIPWIGRGLFNIFEHYPPIQFLYLVPMLTVVTFFSLLFSKRKPDIIHAFGLSGACASGLASRIFRIPCIVDMCTVYRLPKRPVLSWFVYRILNMCDYIRGNHIPGRDELIKIGISPDKLGIITPPVDELVFKPLSQVEVREKLGLSLKNFIALFVGRMVESKNVDIAVDATKLIKNPNVSFVFVGEGPLRNLVIKAANNDNRIIIVDNVKHHDLVYYYNSADILMCAPVDKDLIAFVGREALMCGLPILALNVATYAGIPYTVDNNLVPSKIGYFLDPTPQAIAICLSELIYQKENKGELPFNRCDCSEFAIKNFSQWAMDWLGDSYEKARQIHFLRKSKN